MTTTIYHVGGGTKDSLCEGVLVVESFHFQAAAAVNAWTGLGVVDNVFLSYPSAGTLSPSTPEMCDLLYVLDSGLSG